MKKIVLLLAIFLLTGCANKLFYLTDKYYNEGNFIKVSANEINTDESYLIYTYNNFCVLPVHCENIFKDVMEKYKIDVLSMPFDEFKNTEYHNEVKFAPSILIINNGKIVSFLDANSDKDLSKYQNTEEFEKWLKEYIYLEKK